MSKKGDFFHLLERVLPLVISSVAPKLNPIAEQIQAGMVEAEELHAKGSDKLTHVQNLGKIAADSVNTLSGKVLLDPQEVHSTIDTAASTTITIIKLLQKNKPVSN